MEKEQTGFITIGPKSAYTHCIPVYYTPTEDQIRNIRDMLGWDYVSLEEDEIIQKERYGRQEEHVD